MTAINKNWPRWVFASVSKHIDDRKDGLTLFIEGQHRDTEGLVDFLELRVDGPNFTEVSRGCFHFFVEVNILVQSAMDDSNFHRIHTDVGIAAAALTSSIPVFKYGTGVDDDQSLLGCLRLIQDKRGREKVQVSHFGQIDPVTKLMQATVEGHYEMLLTV